jgi:hypothetical protein
LREKTKSFVEPSGDSRRSVDVRSTNSPGNSLSSSLANLNLADNWKALFPKRQSPKYSSTPSRTAFSLDEEVGKLRRQVHELQQESATKEVTVTQLNKWREQDKEDIKGLNIALDSKQQELELVRRFSICRRSH